MRQSSKGPPTQQTPSPIIPPPIFDSPLHPQGPPIVTAEPELIHITDSTEEEEAVREKPPAPSPHEEGHDNFSIEFAQMQAEVASDREALKGVSSISPLPIDPGSHTRVATCLDPETFIPPPSSSTPYIKSRANFKTEEMLGCPLEALNSIIP
jgi:hypothetical protein